MLTNILFGQARSNAADPPSVKATESPMRQHGSRSFSDHLRDQARRDGIKSVSQKEPNKQPEKAAERRDVDDGPKRADQDKSSADQPRTASDTKTGKGEAVLDGAVVPDTDAVAAGVESDQSEGDLPVLAAVSADTQEETDSQIALDSTEALTQDATAALSVSAQASEKASAQAGEKASAQASAQASEQASDGKTGAIAAAGDAKLAAEAEQAKTGATGNAAKLAAVPEDAKSLTVAAKDSVTPEVGKSDTAQQSVRPSADDLVNTGVENRRSAAEITGSKGMAGNAVGQSAQVLASANPSAVSTQAGAANPALEPTSPRSAEMSEESAPRVETQANGSLASQRSLDANQPRAGGAKATAAGDVSLSAKAAESAMISGAESAKAAQSGQATAESSVEAALRDVTAKTTPTGEALMAAAGQPRAGATVEPGRRAQGRESEAREAQASTTGKGTGIGSAAQAATVAKTAAAAQVSAVQQAFAAQALVADASAAAAQGDALLMAAESGPEMPGLSQLLTEAVLQPGTVHRPETPRLIAAQLAQALVAKGERNVEVALNPEELGRVKMRVTTSDTGITVVIQTERPETGDLMRRHINELADEFRRMGFDNVSFEFSGGGASDGQASSDGDGQSAAGGSPLAQSDEMAAAPVADTPTQQLRMGNAGVDMRV
ncbi:flagellar hook-length control protein FliK [Pseudophaeobacter leonis]|uniref:flagellar hook-length control protein FliK n=1 Tax=Pseudophaeobacter leonis TaxID=1144477 RepID=UPI0009F5509C|nr:flagellar hook-length control protein FliK [Pseudophaeobacter leonis]